MNILIASLRGPTNKNRRGGAQFYIRKIFSFWTNKGFNVKLVCAQDQVNGELLPAKEFINGIEIIRVGKPSTRFIPICRELRKCFFWADVLVENIMSFPLFTPIFKPNDLRTIAIKHHLQGDIFFKQGLIKGSGGYLLENYFFPRVYRDIPIVVNSNQTKKSLQRIQKGKWQDINIISPGVSIKTGNSNKFKNPTILYLGSLDETRKCLGDLILAFKKLLQEIPDAQLLIAGDGPNREELEKKTIDLPVKFLGFVNEEEKFELYRKAWVFASPSIKEGFGMTWIEANSTGLPVVGYDLGLDTVNERCSIMVELHNIVALSEAICKILDNSALRDKMEAESIKNAQNYSWEVSSNKFRDLITNFS